MFLGFSRSIRPYRNLQRIRQIFNILARHGFGYLIERFHLQTYLPWRRRWIRREEIPGSRMAIARRARIVCEELGPTFIKLGQLLSTRPDLLPAEFIQEFSKLQDQVAPLPVEDIIPLIERSMGFSLKDIFSFFDPQPAASASIAQVHKAVLSGGEKVVVKVRRPEIEEIIESDLAILSFLAGIIERRVPEANLIRARETVDEFRRAIRRELDFTIEARNTERIRNNLSSDSKIYIPRVFWNFCRPQVLVLERLEGVNLNEIDRAGEKFSGKEVSQIITRCFFHQIMENGFFHADPHPGNFILMENGQLALVDFGMVGRLTQELREKAARIFISLMERNTERLTEEYLALGIITSGVDLKEFRWDVEDLLDRYYGLPLGRISLGEVINEMGRIALRHHVRMPSNMYLLSRTLITLEGVVRQLDPEFNILETARHYAQTLLIRRFSPPRMKKALIRYFEDTFSVLQNFPHQLDRFFTRVERGELKVEFEHRGWEGLIAELDRAFNRLAFGLIIAALIVGSSLVMQRDSGPQFLGFPFLGIIGYLAAGILGIWLIISIFQSGR